MDLTEPSTELAQLRAEVEKLRLDLNRIESLTRQLDGARDQLRRSTESLERRDVIIREARKQIAALSRKLDEARRDTYEAQKALHQMRGTRWYALRDAVRKARKRPWRWLLVPFRVLRPRRETEPRGPDAPVAIWEPPAAQPARPISPRSPRSLRVAGVVGSALRAQLDHQGRDAECSLFTFGPDDWQAALQDAQPHLLLVESDPFANDGSWQGQLGETPGEELRALIAWCRAREVPTAFWNTADPIEFDRWLAFAGLFDNVFTVDSDAVARYAARGALANANIAALPACVRPRARAASPGGRAVRACFVLTGSHTDDARIWSDARAVLAAVGELVDVYSLPGLEVPEGMPVQARELTESVSTLFSRYAVALSMPARGDAAGKIPQRALEMLASGIAVAAQSSPDVSLHLAPVVETFTGPEEAAGALHKLLDDDGARAYLASQGELSVLRSHTPMDRLAAIASSAGIKVDADAERRVAALVLADTADDASIALRALAAQTRPADEIILGTKARPADLETTAGARIRIVKHDGDARPQRLRELARMASTPWVFIAAATTDPDSIEQLVLRAPFARADAVARAADEVAPVVVRRALVAERGWPDDGETLRRWALEGIRIHALA